MKTGCVAIFVLFLVSGCSAIMADAQTNAIDVIAERVYESGDWKYDFRIEHDLRGSVIGHWGYLSFKGKLVDEDQRIPIGRKTKTPWGPMYVFKYALRPNGPHGWLPLELAKKYAGDHRIEENKEDFQLKSDGDGKPAP